MTFYRRNLPHWQPDGVSIFLTWRLYGSLPASVSTARNGCATRDGYVAGDSPGKRFRRTDSALDTCTSGPMWLKDPRVAAAIVETIQRGALVLSYFALHACVVMPNHVHLLITPKIPVARITNAIKGATSHQAKAILSLKQKHFWQDESFDHWVRSAKEFDRIRTYIENNPVSAGLAAKPEDWPWSSARMLLGGTAISGCASSPEKD